MISMPPFLCELVEIRHLLKGISILTKGNLHFKGQAACDQSHQAKAVRETMTVRGSVVGGEGFTLGLGTSK